jgi:hypothetical protein
LSQPDCNVGFAEDVFVISCTAACDAFDKLYRDPELRQRIFPQRGYGQEDDRSLRGNCPDS